MLKRLRDVLLLLVILAVGACNSVTGPAVVSNDDPNNDGIDKYEEDQAINAGDEFTPPDGGGGGAGPGERDQEEQFPRERHRTPDEWTPAGDGNNVGGPGSSAGSSGGEEQDNGSSGEGGEWTPEP